MQCFDKFSTDGLWGITQRLPKAFSCWFYWEKFNMAQSTGRNHGSTPAKLAEGWVLSRLTPASRLAGANGMQIGPDGRVWVAQVAGCSVSAIDVNSGAIEVISAMGDGITAPDDLAFDDAGNMYCTEITENRVCMRSPNGTVKVIMGDIPVANPITWHQGRLIAGECRFEARIMELDRNGGAPRVILEGVPMANAFEVGPDGKLYFPAQGANEIWRVSLDGGAPEVVAKDLGGPDSVKFHPDGYIVSTQAASGQVLKIDPHTGDKSVLADIGAGLDNVIFVGKRTFVSHITGSIHEIMAPGDARPLVKRGLQWPLGLAVAADGTVFVADGGFVYTVRPGEKAELIGSLFAAGFPGWTRDVVASGQDEWIVTTANGDVARWNVAAQESEVLASGYDRLMGVDRAAGGALAFAEAGTGKVYSLSGGAVEEIASGLAGPMGVAIADDGTVFVSEADAGRVVKLQGGRSEVVLDGLQRPEGLCISGGTLFVIDSVGKTLTSCDLHGGARQLIASQLPVGAPKGLAERQLGGVGLFCGPMWSFTGLAAAADGTIHIAGDAEGSVLSIKAQ